MLRCQSCASKRAVVIIQISSVGGRLAAHPAALVTHAAKWAGLAGFTRSLAQEVASLARRGLRPRTGAVNAADRLGCSCRSRKLRFYSRNMEPSVGAVIKALASYWGNEVSDPVRRGAANPSILLSLSVCLRTSFWVVTPFTIPAKPTGHVQRRCRIAGEGGQRLDRRKR